jgi:hypothetical protein
LRLDRAFTPRASPLYAARVGFSYAYLANARVPAERADEWLASDAAPEAFDAWPSQWRLDTAPFPLTVGALLELMRAEQVARVELVDGRLDLLVLADRGMDAWLTYRAHLAAALRAVSRFGGSGRLLVVTFDDAPHEAGFVVEARPNGESSCSDMSADEVSSIRRGSDYAELRELVSVLFGLDEDDEDDEDELDDHDDLA